jgi:C4-dicarboxylate-specific signal transduction histidine kinase
VQTKAGEAILAVITGRDITERKRMEEELKQSKELLEQRVAQRTEELSSALTKLQAETQKRLQTEGELRDKEQMLLHQGRMAAMGEMIGFIAHQWRQPLNVLGLIVQELPVYYKLGGFTQEYLEASTLKAMEMIHNMAGTIDDFRYFFKTEKQKVWFAVKDLLVKALKLVQARFAEQQIALEVLVEDDVVLEGYPNEFSQVILNMLTNVSDVFQERKLYSRR